MIESPSKVIAETVNKTGQNCYRNHETIWLVNYWKEISELHEMDCRRQRTKELIWRWNIKQIELIFWQNAFFSLIPPRDMSNLDELERICWKFVLLEESFSARAESPSLVKSFFEMIIEVLEDIHFKDAWIWFRLQIRKYMD